MILYKIEHETIVAIITILKRNYIALTQDITQVQLAGS